MSKQLEKGNPKRARTEGWRKSLLVIRFLRGENAARAAALRNPVFSLMLSPMALLSCAHPDKSFSGSLSIALLSHAGFGVSNSMGDFTWQSYFSEGIAVQASLHIFLKLLGIWYI